MKLLNKALGFLPSYSLSVRLLGRSSVDGRQLRLIKVFDQLEGLGILSISLGMYNLCEYLADVLFSIFIDINSICERVCLCMA